uniref:Uncharacterized protein n=1 Tax=Caenorhabditis japonica TaxID=281687 RepID=A0A8R1II14_CAEJA
ATARSPLSSATPRPAEQSYPVENVHVATARRHLIKPHSSSNSNRSSNPTRST